MEQWINFVLDSALRFSPVSLILGYMWKIRFVLSGCSDGQSFYPATLESREFSTCQHLDRGLFKLGNQRTTVFKRHDACTKFNSICSESLEHIESWISVYCLLFIYTSPFIPFPFSVVHVSYKRGHRSRRRKRVC